MRHFPRSVRAEFSFTNTICALSRNMSDMIDEGDIPDILLSQIAEMMECEAKAPDISHMDLYTMKSTILHFLRFVKQGKMSIVPWRV